MIAALLTLLLAVPAITPWVERDGTSLLLSAPLERLFDEALQRRLRSGLTTTLRLQVWIEGHDDARIHGGTWRVARVRWDLWEEHLTAVIDTPDGSRAGRYDDVPGFARDFAHLTALPIARGVAQDETLYRVQIRMEINPLSDEQLARMRSWLVLPAAPSGLEPLGSGLLGSFVRFFDNLKPGVAERTVAVEGHPFRGDRLPYVRR